MIENQQKIPLSSFAGLYDIIIPQDNLLRKINNLIDFQFIYDELESKYCQDNGRMAYNPIMLFKYLMLKVIYTLSDVDVVAQSRYDMSFKYFLGLNPEDDVIDPSTLCKFRKQRLADMDLLDMLLAKSVGIALKEGLIKTNSIIVDATHTGARSNPMLPLEALRKYSKLLRKSAYDASPLSHSALPEEKETNNLEEEIVYIKELVKKVESIPLLNEHPVVKQRLNLLKEKVTDVEENGTCSKDQDARIGYKSISNKFYGYKTHIAMSPERIIIAATVTSGEKFDGNQLPELVNRCNDVGVEVDTVIADGAYSGKQILEMSEEQDIKIVAKLNPQIGTAENRKISSRFTYNKDLNRYVCSRGIVSDNAYVVKLKSGNKVYAYRYRTAKCNGCPLKSKCWKPGAKSMSLFVHSNSTLYEKQMKFQESDEFKQLAKHRYKIEAKNAELKNTLGYRRAISYGLSSMQLQSAVTLFTANIKRILKIQ